jgi:hypothetical protein
MEIIALSRRKVNYINIIKDLEILGQSEEGEAKRNAIKQILYRYNIPKIESLERNLLDYIYSINDEKIRFNFINIIAKSRSLPIISECYSIIYSDVTEKEYLDNRVKNGGKSRDVYKRKYDNCIRLIAQCSYLQDIQRTILEYKENSKKYNPYEGVRVLSHRGRKEKSLDI